jgi:hypothetical protein
VADDKVIMPYFIGDSSGLCHYWNSRFPLGLLAILLAMFDAQSVKISAGISLVAGFILAG